MTRPPPAPLVVRPGRYRTRGGRVATVVGPSDMTTWPWIGRVEGERLKMSWTNDGRQSSDPNIESSIDLIARLPDAKKPKPQPAPGKRGKGKRMEWAIVFPMDDREQAKDYLADMQEAMRSIIYPKPTIRQIPIGRGRGK